MRRVFQALCPLLVVLTFVAAGCSSGTKPTNVNPPAESHSPSTTAPGGGGATTKCTIPQNNGGDHDSDNNGGPDDGDGCDV